MQSHEGTPAYRPATEKALETGLFLGIQFAGKSSGSAPRRADRGLRGPARRSHRCGPWACRLRVAPLRHVFTSRAARASVCGASDAPRRAPHSRTHGWRPASHAALRLSPDPQARKRPPAIPLPRRAGSRRGAYPGRARPERCPRRLTGQTYPRRSLPLARSGGCVGCVSRRRAATARSHECGAAQRRRRP